jgi:hydroxymethylpyrimidine pyrophosphatase-like HAD family hydrolase
LSFPKLFVTDLDGTALDKAHQPYARFPDHFSVFLDELHKTDCDWAISTTWDAGGQGQLVLGSSVKSSPLFLMAEYGMRLAYYRAGMPEFIQPFTKNMEERVAAFNREAAYSVVRDICSRFSPAIMHFYGHMLTFRPVDEESADFRKYIKIKSSEWDEEKLFNYSLNAESSLNIYPRFLNKGLALKEALKISGTAPADIVVAGDETADIDMMQPELARYAVCPENACREVKDHIRKMGCFVGKGIGAAGVIDSFKQLAKKENWKF